MIYAHIALSNNFSFEVTIKKCNNNRLAAKSIIKAFGKMENIMLDTKALDEQYEGILEEEKISRLRPGIAKASTHQSQYCLQLVYFTQADVQKIIKYILQ
jgi:hypothetical protein